MRLKQFRFLLLPALCLVLLTLAQLPGSTAAFASTGTVLVVSPTSINGTTDCSYSATAGWTCQVTLSRGDTLKKNLTWSAYASGLTGVTFSPASGVLAQGGAASVSISIPNVACAVSATLVFKGPANTVRVPWTCTAPALTVNGATTGLSLAAWDSNCPAIQNGWNCTITLAQGGSAQGELNWYALSSLSGVTFTPASGTLLPDTSTPVSIFVPNNACVKGKFSFIGRKSNTVAVQWNCSSPPVLTVDAGSLVPSSSNCTATSSTYQCALSLGETSTSHGKVNWVVSSSLGGASFSLSSGTLSPGETISLTVSSLPCQDGTFTFYGSNGANTVVVSWNCEAATLQANPSTLDPTNSACSLDGTYAATYQCSVILSLPSDAEPLSWSTSNDLGVQPNTGSGNLSGGQQTTVTFDQMPCQNGTLSFAYSGASSGAVDVPWSCTPPVLEVNPSSCPTDANSCTVTLTNASTTQSVNWQISSAGFNSFSTSSGTLSPGASIEITADYVGFDLFCVIDDFTFSGSGGARSVTVSWQTGGGC